MSNATVPEVKIKAPWWERRIYFLSGVIVVLIGVVAALTVALGSAQATAKNAQHVQASCSFYHDLALVQLPEKVSPFGLQIVADARNAFVGMGCGGSLPKPDPRLRPYLKLEAS